MNQDKIILVLSDLHLSAGPYFKGKRNSLEDFYSDKALYDLLQYYSQDRYQEKEVELIINGDFLDFLAVPFVRYFDDEFWSEKAALDKLQIIYDAHQLVFQGLDEFLSVPLKKLTYILGNHDGEMILPALKERFLELFHPVSRSNVTLYFDEDSYFPHREVCIKHGHNYELIHVIDPQKSIIQTQEGEYYFSPPWGSYYVNRVINKFKEERISINAIRPIRYFVIYGLIFDTLFTLRFLFSNLFYFIMVIFISYIKEKKGPSLKEKIRELFKELVLFQDFENFVSDFFAQHPDVKILVVGHTHLPTIKYYSDETVFINTGTWTRMYHLDFSLKDEGKKLTYALIKIEKERVSSSLLLWQGKLADPFTEFEY